MMNPELFIWTMEQWCTSDSVADSRALSATLFDALQSKSGTQLFDVWLSSASGNSVAVHEHQFVATFSRCSRWPSFQLLDVFDCLDIQDCGQVSAELCQMLLCLWLAKQCGRCTQFWEAHGQSFQQVYLKYFSRDGATLGAPITVGTQQASAQRILEFLGVIGGWTASDFSKEMIEGISQEAPDSLCQRLLQFWDRKITGACPEMESQSQSRLPAKGAVLSGNPHLPREDSTKTSSPLPGAGARTPWPSAVKPYRCCSVM
eukprot:RCo034480